MPDMPADAELWVDCLHSIVDRSLRRAQAGRPQALPCQHFRVTQHQTPKFNIAAIDRTNTFATCQHKSSELEEALPGPFRIYTLATCFRVAEFTEACSG